ncbi:MAG: hypothetical protein FWF08_06365 [Oscillospiraceae bacterium]|nr:hypothetical protein [Oscillospiraceae bacterium]
MAAKKKEEQFLTYKGVPLVRVKNTVYYGNPYEDYVVMMQVCSQKKVGKLDVSDRVTVQLINTDPDVRPKDRIVKKSERKGLYNAMDIGAVWLQRALAGNI